jgi:ribonuclease D
VFDTQLAAGFVGHGISMAYDRLVERVAGIRLTHNETFSDWSRRPLTEAQIAYASDDVRYLFAVADALVAKLDEMGRRSWAEDEITRRYGPGATIEPDPQRAYLKVARRGRLSGRQLSALRAVAAWREEEARSRDLPPGWVLKDPSVVEVARRNPADAAALGRLRGLGNLSAPASQRLLEALARAADAEPPAAARELPPGLARRVAAASALGAVLVRARCEGARIAPELVATRAELESFVEAMAAGQDGHALLTGWRRDLVGAELKELVQGNVALALDPQAPYVRTFALPSE